MLCHGPSLIVLANHIEVTGFQTVVLWKTFQIWFLEESIIISEKILEKCYFQLEKKMFQLSLPFLLCFHWPTTMWCDEEGGRQRERWRGEVIYSFWEKIIVYEYLYRAKFLHNFSCFQMSCFQSVLSLKELFAVLVHY